MFYKKKRFFKGFTLVEVMLVVVIILVLASLAINNILRARIFAQETAVLGALRTVAVAQTEYRATNFVYTSLFNLGAPIPPYLDSNLAAGDKYGYLFASTPVIGQEGVYFTATATPKNLNQARTFYTDEDGVLCASDVINTATPVGHVTNGCPIGFSAAQ